MSITTVYTHLLNFLYLEQSCIRDKVYGAVGRRAVVMVFASSSANFFTGSNQRRLSGLSHLDNFITTRNISTLTRTYAKTHANPDTDGNSLYHRAVSIQAITRGQVTDTMTISEPRQMARMLTENKIVHDYRTHNNY